MKRNGYLVVRFEFGDYLSRVEGEVLDGWIGAGEHRGYAGGVRLVVGGEIEMYMGLMEKGVHGMKLTRFV